MKFAALPGVKGTRVGYTGAEAPNPTYNSVCRGDGHTEALRVEFDPKVISYEQLLDAFFDQHMPTRKSKAQYKSAVWTHDEEQAKVVKKKIAEVQGELGVAIATDVEPAKKWYDAEEYHQKYIAKQSRGGGRSIFGF